MLTKVIFYVQSQFLLLSIYECKVPKNRTLHSSDTLLRYGHALTIG